MADTFTTTHVRKTDKTEFVATVREDGAIILLSPNSIEIVSQVTLEKEFTAKPTKTTTASLETKE